MVRQRIWVLTFENESERALEFTWLCAPCVCLAKSSKTGCQLRPVPNTTKHRCVAYISQALLNQQTNQLRMKDDLAKLTARRSTPARSANDKQEIQTLELPLFFATAKPTCSMHGACAVKMMNLLVSMAATDLGASEQLRPLASPLLFAQHKVRAEDEGSNTTSVCCDGRIGGCED